MHTTQMMGIPKLRIFGDSLVIINWEKGTASLTPPELYHWCRDTRKLCSCFLELSFCHIYREFNQLADCLSKNALSLAPRFGNFSEFIEGHLTFQDCFVLFWAWCGSMFSLFFYCTTLWFVMEQAPFRLLFYSLWIPGRHGYVGHSYFWWVMLCRICSCPLCSVVFGSHDGCWCSYHPSDQLYVCNPPLGRHLRCPLILSEYQGHAFFY